MKARPKVKYFCPWCDKNVRTAVQEDTDYLQRTRVLKTCEVCGAVLEEEWYDREEVDESEE